MPAIFPLKSLDSRGCGMPASRLNRELAEFAFPAGGGGARRPARPCRSTDRPSRCRSRCLQRRCRCRVGWSCRCRRRSSSPRVLRVYRSNFTGSSARAFSTASGARSMTVSSTRALASGRKRFCSQSARVPSGNPNRAGKLGACHVEFGADGFHVDVVGHMHPIGRRVGAAFHDRQRVFEAGHDALEIGLVLFRHPTLQALTRVQPAASGPRLATSVRVTFAMALTSAWEKLARELFDNAAIRNAGRSEAA